MNVIRANLIFRNPLTPLDLSKIKYLIIHHAEAISASPEEIHQWHMDNGWAGFGYNEYITKDGTVYIGRGDNVGAHSYGYNSVSYGICTEGDYSIEKIMPKEQFNSLVERLKFHKNRFKDVKIVGHIDLYNTDCPGRNFPILQAIDAAEKQPEKPHWAKSANDELMVAGILSSDHTASLDKPATEGMVLVLVNKIRKAGNQL